MIEQIASAIENSDFFYLPKIFDIKFINKSRDSFRSIALNPSMVKTRIQTKPWPDIVTNIANISLCNDPGLSENENTHKAFEYFSKASSAFLLSQTEMDVRCSAYKSICMTCIYFSTNELCYNESTTLLRKLYNDIIKPRTQALIISNNPTLAIVNSIIKINLMRNNYNLAEKTFDSLNKTCKINLDSFNVSDLATYFFFKGKVDMVYGYRNYAYHEFRKSIQYIPLNNTRDRRLVLVHFIPVCLSFGIIPTDELLKNYNLYDLYSSFTIAITTGNLALYNQALNDNQSLLIHFGVWEMIVYSRRMVIRRILQMVKAQSETNRVPIEAFQRALSLSGDEFSFEETVLEIANLIYDKLVMANIAYQYNLIVFKDKDEFSLPPPEEITDD